MCEMQKELNVLNSIQVKYDNTNRYNSISEINPEKENQKILVRDSGEGDQILVVPDFATKKIPHLLELEVIDSEVRSAVYFQF